jgi:hypothetical protein
MVQTEFHLEYTEPLITKYICTDQVKGDEMRGNAARTREKRNIYIYIYIYRVFVRKLERKRSLGRYIPRCEDNIKTYLREIRWDED